MKILFTLIIAVLKKLLRPQNFHIARFEQVMAIFDISKTSVIILDPLSCHLPIAIKDPIDMPH